MTAVVTAATVTVRPERLRSFGDPTGCTFWAVTSPSLAPELAIEPAGGYDSYRTIVVEDGQALHAALAALPSRSHVLVAVPGHLFESPAADQVGERKLLVLPCGSTPTSADAVAWALEVCERTDPEEQAAFADRFFASAEAADRLELVDAAAGTSAVFDHLAGDYEWNQQAGPLDWGDQQVAPPGELSVEPTRMNCFDPALRLAFDGQVALRGQPVLHAGRASFSPADQARLHAALATMADHAVVAEVDSGVITGVRATHRSAQPAADTLEALFRVDSRYRIVWELGFGINTAMKPIPGNVAANQVYGATGGVFHVGVGLSAFTQYAVMLPCLGTQVTGAGETLIAGVTAPRRRLNVRRDGAGCGCRI